jgi:hypothetical protein
VKKLIIKEGKFAAQKKTYLYKLEEQVSLLSINLTLKKVDFFSIQREVTNFRSYSLFFILVTM